MKPIHLFSGLAGDRTVNLFLPSTVIPAQAGVQIPPSNQAVRKPGLRNALDSRHGLSSDGVVRGGNDGNSMGYRQNKFTLPRIVPPRGAGILAGKARRVVVAGDLSNGKAREEVVLQSPSIPFRHVGVTAGRQRGYVLITTLATMVLLILVASRLDVVVERFRSETRDWGRWAEAQGLLASARDEVLFAMATRQLSPWGFGTGPGAIRADGRLYRAESGALVNVQDERGLISLNLPNQAILRNYLLASGVPDREVEPLLDTLADYSDTDSLHRLNGAETAEYVAVGLPPPRNDWLLSPHEIRQILRWRDYPAVWSRAGEVFSAARGEPFNANHAPRAVLSALPGATPEGVAALMARREVQPFASVAELRALTGIRLNEEEVLLHPGVLYRLQVWLEGGLPGIEYHIILTPGGQRAPWIILEARQIAHPNRIDANPEILPLPSLPVAKPDTRALPPPFA